MLVTFDIYFDGEFWCARGMGVDIFTQGTTLDELMQNVKYPCTNMLLCLVGAEREDPGAGMNVLLSF